jgi:sirohydrochlorin cobaltochelatase
MSLTVSNSDSDSNSPTTGLLLFAHGARDPRWAEPFAEVAQRVKRLAPTAHVQLAFLEFMTPSLREAGQALAELGCSRVDVVPLFLGAGGHVRKDLPALLAELSAAYPLVQWQLQRAIGEMSSVIEAMACAAAGALQTAPNAELTAELTAELATNSVNSA